MGLSLFSMHTTRDNYYQALQNAEKLIQISELTSNKSDEITFSSPTRLFLFFYFIDLLLKKSGYIGWLDWDLGKTVYGRKSSEKSR
jgi:hypothetical protein